MPREIDPDLLQPAHYSSRAFPDSAWQWFREACSDLEIPVSPDKRQRLEAVYSHLLGVNEWMNLTRITTPLDFLKFHVLDSLTALPIAEDVTQPGDLCIDLGSGGGYPGIPLAIWLPDRQWTLVDSRRKKVAFLEQALTLTPCQNARAKAFRGREGDSAAPELARRAALVVARAVGRADTLLQETVDLLREDGLLIVLKGPSYETAERQNFLDACPKFGFEPAAELRVSLDPGDPERLIVLATRSGRPRSRRKGRYHRKPHT